MGILLLSTGCAIHVSSSPPDKSEAEIAREEREAELKEDQQRREELARRQKEQDDAARARWEDHEKEVERDRQAEEDAREARRQAWEQRQAEAKAAAESTGPDEGSLAYEWADANCKLSQPPSHYVKHCDPVCWEEEVMQCPVYTCSKKPPKTGWVELANQRVCSAARGTTNRRARAIGESGYPRPQGGR